MPGIIILHQKCFNLKSRSLRKIEKIFHTYMIVLEMAIIQCNR